MAVRFRKELLGNDALQYGRQLDPHLLLLIRREYIDDPVNGLGRADGMQRGKYQMAGLRRCQRLPPETAAC